MARRFTHGEISAAMQGLSESIGRYADLLVRKGCAVQQGQELVVTAPVERADFVRMLVRKAYRAGVGHVTVQWNDDELRRLEYENNGLSYFQHVPSWKREQLNGLAAEGAAFLQLSGTSPTAMEGIDPAKIAAASRSRQEECKTYFDGMLFGKNAWCIAGVPIAGWAKAVFPQSSADEAELRLWRAILSAARSDGDDPQAEWERHNATFEKNKRILNGYAFDKLRYKSSNGTDFELGLNPGHLWDGGAGKTEEGVVFFPNIPTEEVFTSPDRARACGIVYSALPLVYGGRVVRDFWFRFNDGKVVEYGASEGRDVLGSILSVDDNACRLGECALVAKDTPIRQSGLMFYDTLYDENASCHLALGAGFPECIEGGYAMSEQDLVSAGVNYSSAHVDFMIGADDMQITGVTHAGEEVPIFLDGRWAWYGE